MIKTCLIFSFFVFECLSFQDEKIDKSSSSERSYFAEILDESLFDYSVPWGLNLEAVAQNQYNQRMQGIGTGFSADIYGLSVVNGKLNYAYEGLVILLQEENFLKRAAERSKLIKKRLKSIPNEIENKRSEITLLRQTQEFFLEKLIRSGLTREQLNLLPNIESFPKASGF